MGPLKTSGRKKAAGAAVASHSANFIVWLLPHALPHTDPLPPPPTPYLAGAVSLCRIHNIQTDSEIFHGRAVDQLERNWS